VARLQTCEDLKVAKRQHGGLVEVTGHRGNLTEYFAKTVLMVK